MYKCLVVGSRTITDYNLIKKHLDFLLQGKDDVEIVSGGANGVDKLAKRYAAEHNLKYRECPALWRKYGRSAGYKRNVHMHRYISQFPDRICVAFWDGISKGTQQSFDLSKQYNNEIVIVKET